MWLARTGIISSGGVSILPLLDTYTGAVGAYSTYKLRTLYVGSAIRVRRSSDNAEQNIGFVGNDLDTASLLSFVGANNGFVTTIYDQSGNGYNFTQTTADYQPSIVLSGTLNTKNGKPTIIFDGASDYMEIPTSTGNLSFLHKTGQSFISVVGYNRIASEQMIIVNNYGSSASTGYALYTNGASNITNFTSRGVSGQGTVANASNTAPIPTNSLYLLNNETDNGNATASLRSKLYVNNGSSINLNSLTNTPSSANATYNLFLGVAGGGGARYGYYDGGISQLIIWNSNQSSNRVGMSNAIREAFSITFDADAQSFITAAGITDGTQISSIDTLVKDLKAANVWSKMGAIYPMIGGTATSHMFNLRYPNDNNASFRLSFVGGWTHSSTGARPNGTTAYANTFYKPSDGLLDSTHMSYYSRTSATAGTAIDMGSIGGTNYHHAHIKYSGDLMFGLINTSTVSSTSMPGDVSQGLYCFSRVSSATIQSYKNGTIRSLLGLTSSARNTNNIYLGAGNINEVASQFGTKEIAFASIGTGLNDAENLVLYNAVQAFQSTLGRQIV
jgi:hypothetical protein